MNDKFRQKLLATHHWFVIGTLFLLWLLIQFFTMPKYWWEP